MQSDMGVTNGVYKGSMAEIDLATPPVASAGDKGMEVGCEDGGSHKTKGRRLLGQTKDIMQRFCEDTSIQGLKQVAEAQPYTLRRLFWLVLLVFGTVVFFIQFVNSVQYFLSNPVAVNIEVNYNKTMVFPAVTICNQNAFQMTKTYKKDWYDMINYWYDKNSNLTSDVIAEKKQISLDTIYKEAAHNMSDFIVSCHYDQMRCKVESFTSRITDYGQCYTFNFHLDYEAQHMMARSGVLGGLQLVLNAEQYDYMIGPNSGAGVRVLVHEQHETPRVRDYGDAIPTGMRAMIAVQRIEVENLPPNYGSCDREKEKNEYGGHYTLSICETRCIERYLQPLCNCRTHASLYGNYEESSLPVCTVGDFECLAKETVKFHHQNIDCRCQPACNEVAFDTSVTYSWMSNYDLLQFLGDNEMQKLLRKKILEAREISQRVRPQYIKNNIDTTARFSVAVEKLDQALMSILSGLQEVQKNATVFLNDLEHRMNFHRDRGLGAVKFTYEKDFMRGWQMFEERGINQVTPEFFGTSRIYNLTVEFLVNDTSLSPAERYALYLGLLTQTEAKLTMVKIAEEYINQTEDALRSGEPLLTYALTLDRRYDMKYLPYTLVNNSETQEHEYDELMLDITQLTAALEYMQDTTKLAYEYGNVPSSDMYTPGDEYVRACKGYNYRVFMYKTYVLDKPFELIQEKIANFGKLRNTLNQNKETFFFNLDALLKTTVKQLYHSESWVSFKELKRKLNLYISDKSSYKLPLMESIAQRHTKDMYAAMVSGLTELANGVLGLTSSATNLMMSANNMWKAMLEEESTKLAYTALKEDVDSIVNGTANRTYLDSVFAHMLRRNTSSVTQLASTDFYSLLNADFPATAIADKSQEINRLFRDLQQAFNLEAAIHNIEEEFKDSFEDVIDDANRFITSVKIDERFYLNNFLTLDIYMKEMRYQKITQLPAYDITKLLSDIGGSLGLFAGASVFTVVEVFDFFFYQNLILHRRKKDNYDMNSD